MEDLTHAINALVQSPTTIYYLIDTAVILFISSAATRGNFSKAHARFLTFGLPWLLARVVLLLNGYLRDAAQWGVPKLLEHPIAHRVLVEQWGLDAEYWVQALPTGVQVFVAAVLAFNARWIGEVVGGRIVRGEGAREQRQSRS